MKRLPKSGRARPTTILISPPYGEQLALRVTGKEGHARESIQRPSTMPGNKSSEVYWSLGIKNTAKSKENKRKKPQHSFLYIHHH
jgi:hypothetical protein